MLKQVVILLTIQICLSCTIAKTEAADASCLTAISDGTVNKYEAFPDVVRMTSGELLLVYYAGPTHGGPGGDVVLIRSSDNGLTWSPPQVIYAGPADDRDPSLFCTRDGTLLCSMMTDYDRRDIPAMKVQIIRSNDNGQTWSEPIEINSPFRKLTACSSPMIQLANGDLLLPVYGRETQDGYESDEAGKRDRVAVVRSTDNGKTWNSFVIIDESPEYKNQEPSLCLLPSGRILCMMRDRGGVSWSDDDGKTWSPVKYLNWDLDCPYLYAVTEQVIVCGMRHRNHGPSITITVSADGGMTWSDPQLMSDGNGAYPSIQRVTDDTYIYVYYRDETGPARIHRIYFQVADDGVITRISPDEFTKIKD
ncbi:MAG: sialidase family protein [Planctomycetia bacterium]|nr:sialidase family protein [Planctomycetia bacterium]